jgi:hypothetical protein
VFVSLCLVVRTTVYWLILHYLARVGSTIAFILAWRTSIIGDFALSLSEGALLVHLWLPLFAISVVLLKGLNYFLLAAKTAQWFLKRGKDHPLEAVGFVAAPLVFIGATAVQLLVSR